MLLASFMDCAGISLQAEGRAMQWLRGTGRRLRVDGDCAGGGAAVRVEVEIVLVLGFLSLSRQSDFAAVF